MKKRNDAQPSIPEEERGPEHPVRPDPDEPDTMVEGPGARLSAREEQDAKSIATRTGER